MNMNPYKIKIRRSEDVDFPQYWENSPYQKAFFEQLKKNAERNRAKGVKPSNFFGDPVYITDPEDPDHWSHWNQAKYEELIARFGGEARINEKVVVSVIFKESLVSYPAPPNFNYWWIQDLLLYFFFQYKLLLDCISNVLCSELSCCTYIIVDLTNEIYFGWCVVWFMQMEHHFFFFVFMFICAWYLL